MKRRTSHEETLFAIFQLIHTWDRMQKKALIVSLVNATICFYGLPPPPPPHSAIFIRFSALLSVWLIVSNYMQDEWTHAINKEPRRPWPIRADTANAFWKASLCHLRFFLVKEEQDHQRQYVYIQLGLMRLGKTWLSCSTYLASDRASIMRFFQKERNSSIRCHSWQKV